MKCLLHSHSLFMPDFSFSLPPPSLSSLVYSLSFPLPLLSRLFSLSLSLSLSLSFSLSCFLSISVSLVLSFPREFDHLANPVVARQTEAFRAIPDGAFIFLPPTLPLDLLLLIFLSPPSSPTAPRPFFFPLVPTKYIGCLAARGTPRRIQKGPRFAERFAKITRSRRSFRVIIIYCSLRV